MFYRMSVALTVCLVLPVVIGFLWDKPPANGAHDTIVQLEDQWLAGEDDPGVLESILADDFVHVLSTGFVTKNEQIDYVRGHQGSHSEIKHFEDLRVRMFSNVAVANGTVVGSSRNGKIVRTLFTDVFFYRNGKWQAVNAQETPLTESSSH
jgi:uncharacterized protein DUF4440